MFFYPGNRYDGQLVSGVFLLSNLDQLPSDAFIVGIPDDSWWTEEIKLSYLLDVLSWQNKIDVVCDIPSLEELFFEGLLPSCSSDLLRSCDYSLMILDEGGVLKFSWELPK